MPRHPCAAFTQPAAVRTDGGWLVRELRARKHRIGPKRVSRLMAEERIRGKVKGGFKLRPAPVPSLLPGNLLDRRFTVGS